MGVMRVHKNANFTVMSNYHFKEKKMSLKAKGLLSLMLSLPDTWNYSVSGLVTLSKDGKDSVMSALSELESFGYLKRTRVVNDKGQFSGMEYDIYEEPQQEMPIAENPTSVSPILENSHAENPPQLNTNSINHLKNNNIDVFNTYSEELEKVKDPGLRELYLDYAEMRVTMDFPLSKRGMKMLIQRCEKLSNGLVRIQKLLLEAAIINNWKNVYPPHEKEAEFINQQHIDELKSFYNI